MPLLEKHRLLMPGEDEATRRTDLAELLSRLSVNLVVDHHAAQGAPVVVEENPVFRNLLGGMVEDEVADERFCASPCGQFAAGPRRFFVVAPARPVGRCAGLGKVAAPDAQWTAGVIRRLTPFIFKSDWRWRWMWMSSWC
jgi:hypothetical protein